MELLVRDRHANPRVTSGLALVLAWDVEGQVQASGWAFLALGLHR